MENITRKAISELIFSELEKNKSILINQFQESQNGIGFFYLDQLLPLEIANKIQEVFPSSSQMIHKKSIRENKFVGAQMNNFNPILEEVIYAFQDKNVVKIIGEICNINQPIPDHNLYAGGLSAMGKNQFLNPHLDNSHDKYRNCWRVLNLLYYVTSDWKEEFGGNLELWPNGLSEKQITIHSKFNRLVVMATHNKSIHSVSPVIHDGFRCCVSNYYFSEKPLLATDTFHVTSFRGRPENKFTDLVLQVDTFLRMTIRKIFKKGIRENPHVYKKN